MQGKSEREVKVLKEGVKVPKLARQIVALPVRVKTPSERKSIAGKRSGGPRRPLVDIPELDGVVRNRKINLGDRAFLALNEIRFIGQPNFVGGWGAETEESAACRASASVSARTRTMAVMDTSKTNSRIDRSPQRETISAGNFFEKFLEKMTVIPTCYATCRADPLGNTEACAGPEPACSAQTDRDAAWALRSLAASRGNCLMTSLMHFDP